MKNTNVKDKIMDFYQIKVNPVKWCIADIISSIAICGMKKQVIFK